MRAKLHTGWEAELILIQGSSRDGILGEARTVRQRIAADPDLELLPLAAQLARPGDPAARAPLAIVAGSAADLDRKLAHALERLADPKCTRLRERAGVYYFEQPLAQAGSLAFLFPGEGAQYHGMLADVCLHFDAARRWLDLVERTCLERRRGPGLGELLYGDADERELWATDLGAATVFAANQALLAVIRSLGIEPAMVAGHSTGDYSALFAAGALDLTDAGVVDACRALGEIYTRARGAGRIPDFALLAVAAPDPESLLAPLRAEQVFVALDNCPHQVVLAMESGRIDSVASELAAAGAVCSRLPYGHGYHTPAFGGFAEMLAPFVDGLPLRAPVVPLWSCATAAPYPADPGEVRALLVEQWIRPVRFGATVEAMYEAGARLFIEVGPRGNLTGFLDDILRRRPHLAFASNVQPRGGLEQLAHLAGVLAAHGVPVDLEPLLASRLRDRSDRAKPPPHRVTVALPSLAVPGGTRARDPAAALGGGVATVLEEHLRTIERLVIAQEGTMRSYLAGRGRAGSAMLEPAAAPAASSLLGEVIAYEPGHRIEAERTLAIDNDRFLRDHTLGRNVSLIDPDLAALPVVPLTVSIDLLATAAAALAPGLRPAALRSVRAHRWIALDTGEVTLAIRAERIDGDAAIASISLSDQQDPAVEATVELAPQLPPSPAPSLPPLSDPRRSRWADGGLYEEGMFHGPSLQGVASVDAWSEDGIDGTLRSLPTDVLGPSAAPLADPILLDAAGQLIGYWSAENERVDVFPFAVEGIELFAETLPPGRTVACRARVCRSSSATLRSDLELSCGERVHARISGWQNRCFSVPRELFELRVDPRTARLGRDLDAGRAGARCCLVDAFTDELLASGGGIWRMALAHLILSVPERREWDALQTHRERGNAWLRGRAAAKGAVRALSGTGQTPADIRIATLDTGRPCVAGDPGVSISIAHSGERAVALAAAGVAGAGIDLEPSRPLPADSVPIAFDAAELSELAAGDTESTWLTRGWCAKESVAKALGSGLDRGPGRLKVTRADRATGVITVTGTGRTMDASTLDDGETVAAICVLHHQQEGTCASRRRPLATKL